ncbi:MAG: ATP-binding protein [Pyramidobacter sp.]|nr:ATP-binding protein [Pyramidobacter sp.]
MTGESLTVEYKREYIDDIKKTIIAFANTDGGELLIGVDDDGTVLGVDDPDDVMLKVTNSARDTIKPDVTTFMRVEPRTILGKSIISVSVQKGTACPYYLGAKGIRPEGVFVRQGASTVPATESTILKMIRETSGESFEKARSLIQELTFGCAKQHFFRGKSRIRQSAATHAGHHRRRWRVYQPWPAAFRSMSAHDQAGRFSGQYEEYPV